MGSRYRTESQDILHYLASSEGACRGRSGSRGHLRRSLHGGRHTACLLIRGYLNHIGTDLLESWDDVEQKLGWRPKLSLLGELLPMKPDFGKRPFQLLPDVFRFRDAIAHGKTKPERRPDQPFPDTSEEQWDEGPGANDPRDHRRVGTGLRAGDNQAVDGGDRGNDPTIAQGFHPAPKATGSWFF